MKIIIFVIGSVLIVFGLMILQLRSMRRYHPNAELLMYFLKLLGSHAIEKNP